ncbi:MAG: hypothetical protein U0232_01935 [Thermomicrobiales bacterium]
MLNFRVADLDGLLADFMRCRCAHRRAVDEYSYGRFAWVYDLEDKIELASLDDQPAAEAESRWLGCQSHSAVPGCIVEDDEIESSR